MRPVLLAVLALLAIASPAEAAFTLANPSSKPDDVSAGAHANVKLHVEPQGGQIRDLDLHFPPGLIGDPNATPRCPVAQFDADGQCPDATRVGTASNTATLGVLLSQKVTGPIFNLTPQGKEPALLGIRVDTPFGAIKLKSPVTTRPTDQGLDSTLRDIPNQIGGVSITITALDVELFGKVGAKAFMTNPTSCATATTGFDAVSYAGDKASAQASFTPVNCGALPFDPQFSAVLGGAGDTNRGKHPELTTVVTQTAGEANTKRVAVTLPKVLTVELSQLARACAPDALASGSCPATSTIGEATAVTPLLTTPLRGPVLFVKGAGALPDVMLQLRGQLSLNLRGVNTFTPSGQRTTFDGLPDVPLSRFELRFTGGEGGLLTTGLDLCAITPPVLEASFTAHSGKTKEAKLPAKVDGCPAGTGGGTASAAKPPTATLRLAGRSVRLTVDGRGRRLRRVRIALPKGVTVVRRARGSVSGSGAKGAKLRFTRRTVTLTVPGDGAQRVGVALRSGAVRGARRLRTRAAAVRITGTDGRTASRRVRAAR